MTLLTFFGCALTAYGPGLAIFFGCVAPNAQLVILMVSSMFFWLLSLLLASAIWFLATNSRQTYTSTIIYTILLQEMFRWFLYLLINRAEKGLNMVAKHPKSRFNRSGYAFSAGLGFGLMFGIISYITQLVQSLGPGVLMCISCPSVSLYFISAITTCIITLHHCLWMMISFTGFTQRSYARILWVLVSHYGASYLTLLNSSRTVTLGCAYSIICNIALLFASAIIAFTDLRNLHQKFT
ncbi:gamma secretase complex protein [Lobosporangium transversale]|uniref:Gamma-secretase subunit Aph-1 n=1 Tax=Lobosporangium transversale TaxID=64571 RepID=A0A1Y2GFG6_9FUNG|nr:gamma-secretase subunit Aph-1 [Lobosporangium transversale]KAF9905999.1 gamma secretase complex protein [Lobosporangium transversale]ORZ09360.1 gamma-secretase subunit Aph-1 [Lobosporangium transversale]|eukprot:XP_021878813.1 gamma-secretase subunit Aph-1 [Lobosporangium transversale]